MKKVFSYSLSLFISCLLLVGCTNIPSKKNNITSFSNNTKETTTDTSLLKYVDPFIGTGGHGHTFPGAVVPFGMVQLSPDNISKGWDWTSGYHYSDNELVGFSHTHLSGTGVGDLLDILFMPFRGEYSQRRKEGEGFVISQYSHDKEKASPGYYSVELPNEQVTVELTATERTGIHRYHFKGDTTAQLLVDLGYSQNYDKPVATMLRVLDDKTILGYRISTGWAKHQAVYFIAKFNHSFEHQLYIEGNPINGQIIQGENSQFSEIVLSFNNLKNKPLVAKVGLSYSSIHGAKENLKVEAEPFDFEQIKLSAEQKWVSKLNQFNVIDNNENNKTKFYTALYHSYLAPQIFNDVNGDFYGADGSLHHGKNYQRYSLFSLWDTFRALHPLLTISEPDKIDNMVKSMLGFYEETGVLPTWDLMSNETDVMIGYHAVPVIIDAYFKGLTQVDPEKIFEACKTSAMQQRFGIHLLDQYGYIPSELEIEAVSKTLEYAFDDWAIAQLAKALGKIKDYEYFIQRSQSYRNLFDTKTQFMRGKNKHGEWVKNFNPIYVDHRKTDYTEANAWQYTWFVPHNIKDLIHLFGSEKTFIKKLDQLFTISSTMEGDVSPDISGLIGQYAHGNEPCHHIPYLYSYTKDKWKGEQRIKEIRETMYATSPDGLAGNDDVGQISAWFVFSALGFYPVNPVDGQYVLGTPLFKEVQIKLDNGKQFIIKQEGDSKNNYINQTQLNNTLLNTHSITHDQLMSGGELLFSFGKSMPELK